MNLKQGLSAWVSRWRWLLPLALFFAALGPSPVHDGGFTFRAPIGAMLFVVSRGGLQIVATLFAIYFCLTLVTISLSAILWGSLKSVETPSH